MLANHLFHCEIIQKNRKTSNLNHIYKNQLDKGCFVHDASYSNGKDLAKRTIPDIILLERPYEIAINPKYDRCQTRLARMVHRYFEKKTRSEAKTKKYK